MVTPNFSSYPALLLIAVNLSLAGQTSLANEGEPVVREHRESLFCSGQLKLYIFLREFSYSIGDKSLFAECNLSRL
jgi:hypothetical protein